MIPVFSNTHLREMSHIFYNVSRKVSGLLFFATRILSLSDGRGRCVMHSLLECIRTTTQGCST